MNRKKLLISLVILFFSVTASAEIYKFYDEQGNVHFTDDYNKIPIDQRKNVKGYKEILSEEAGEETAEADRESPGEKEQSPSAEAGESGKFDFDTKIKEFDRRKQELALEYESLMAESAKLTQEKAKAKTAADVKLYNTRVSDLNRKIKEHDRKRKEFFDEVDAYNAWVNEENTKKQQKQSKKK
ncbi:MAG: DUF4124 domain-containing protein [Deltaproteobacteria bacterium]|nr:MAG: DUF4124 domain-containing protein [Deltaproteobacteria bacterium]